MSNLSISTIIPAYNAAKMIGRALDSVLAQTRLSDEILVIDDGSPDDLPGAIAGYRDQVTLIRQANGGAASARNRGIDQARGDLIAFLDADDFWEPTKLERQLEVFQKHPEIGLVASRHFSQEPGQRRILAEDKGKPCYNQLLRANGEQAFELATRIWTSTVMIRRQALGPYRFDGTLVPAEDRDVWLQLVTAGPVYLIEEPLATAVLEPGSLSRSNVDVAWSNMLRVVQKNSMLLGRPGLRRWESKIYRHWAAGHLSNGEPRAALRPAGKRLQRQPLTPQAWWIFLKSAFLALTPARGPHQISHRTTPNSKSTDKTI